MLSAVRTRSLWTAAVVAAAGLVAGSPRASAETVKLAFDKTTGQSATVTFPENGSPKTVSTTPGPYYWHPVGGTLNSQFPATTTTFCVELGQPVSVGSSYTFDVKPVADVVGAAKAGQFLKLWGAHFDTAWATSGFAGSVASTAFQLAVWELVYDGPGSLNLAGGNFLVPNANLATTSTAAGLAKSWLDGLAAVPASTFDTRYPGQQLVWLSNGSAQDQLTMIPAAAPNPVPGPAGAVLGLVGLGGMGLARLRRRKA